MMAGRAWRRIEPQGLHAQAPDVDGGGSIRA